MNDSKKRAGGAYSTNAPPYRFCPVCGHALHSKVIKPTEPERLVCPRCSFVLYLDPKVAVGTIGTINGEIFLLKRSIEPALGKWVFPGGYVERGETLEAAAVREAAEESNLDVKIDGLLNVYSYEGRPIVVVVYVVSVAGGRLSAGDEALEVRLFRPEDIPWQDLAFPSTKDALEDYLRIHLGIEP